MTFALREITFPSKGIPCGAWHLTASSAACTTAISAGFVEIGCDESYSSTRMRSCG